MTHVSSGHLMAVVALCIILGPTLATRVRLPGLVGLVLAGMVVGPYVLGLIGISDVAGIGTLGVLYLMYQAGLEIDLNMFEQQRTAALVFGVLTFVFPFALGAVVGIQLGYTLAAAALIGSIWASHTLVTLPDIKESGLGRNRAVTATAAATVLTDTLALVILAVVASITRGGSVSMVVSQLVAGLVVLALYTLIVLPRIGRVFFMRSGHQRTVRFAWLLFGLSSAAVVAELFGIEGLVGSFLAGVGSSRLVPNRGALMERVDFFGAALLVPAFLIYVGTQLDPSVLIQLDTIRLAGWFLGALLLGKVLAALVSGRVLQFSWAESGLMLGMSIPQAAATLAATLVGADIGLFDQGVVNSVVLVVLVSILVGSVITRAAAIRMPLPGETGRSLGDMVVVGVTSDAHLTGLMTVAHAVASEDSGNIEPVVVAAPDGWDQPEAVQMRRAVDQIASEAGADVESAVRYSESVSRGMLEVTAEERATLLLMSLDRKPTLSELAFGGLLDRIGRESSCPMVVARFESEQMECVVLWLDSPEVRPSRYIDSRVAARVAQRLARSLGVPFIVYDPTGELPPDLDWDDPETIDCRVLTRGLRPRDIGLGSNDVLVIPSAIIRGLGGTGPSLYRKMPGISVLVTAGPHRFRFVRGSVRIGNYLGVEVGTAVTPLDR